MVFKNLHKETIIKIFSQLRDLERIVVVLRYGLPLENYIPKDEFVNTLYRREIYTKKELETIYNRLCGRQNVLTLEAVGKILNITRERVRQIEAKGLRRLRLPSNSEKLKSLIKG